MCQTRARDSATPTGLRVRLVTGETGKTQRESGLRVRQAGGGGRGRSKSGRSGKERPAERVVRVSKR